MNKMPSQLYDTLKEKLGDEKYDEKSILELMVEVYDKSEAAKEIQTANGDLTAKKKELSSKVEELTQQIETVKSENEEKIKKLMDNSLSDEDKIKLQQMKEKGMSTELEAKFNELMEQVKTSNNRVAELEELYKTESVEKKAAKLEVFKTDGLTKLERALNAVGIKGRNAEAAMSIIDKRKLYDVVDNDEGFAFNVYTKRDGQLFPSNSNDLAAEIAKEFENFVEPSGNTGGSSQYNPSNVNNNTQNVNNLQEARNQTQSLLSKFFN